MFFLLESCSEAILEQEGARERLLRGLSPAARLFIDSLHHLLDVLADDICLDVEEAARLLAAEVRHFTRVRDQRDGKVRLCDSSDGQADAVERDGALLDDAAQDGGVGRDLEE